MSTGQRDQTMENDRYKPLYDSNESPIYEIDPEAEAEIEELINPPVPVDDPKEFEDVGQSVTTAGVTWSSGTVSSTGGGASITIYLTFDRTISGLSSSDIETQSDHAMTNTTSNWNISVSQSSTTSISQRITVTLTPRVAIHGSVRLKLKSNSLRSGGSSSDNYPSSDALSRFIPISNAPYFITPVTGGTRISARLWFRYPAKTTNIDSSDFQVRQVQLGNVGRLRDQDDSSNWTISVNRSTAEANTCLLSTSRYITVTAIPNGEKRSTSNLGPVSYYLRFQASGISVGGISPPSSQANSTDVNINNWPHWTAESGGRSLTGRFWTRYSFPLTNIDSSDFQVLLSDSSNSNRGVQSGWSISVDRSSLPAPGGTGRRYAIVTATPPDDTWGYFRIDTISNSMKIGSTTITVPIIEEISSAQIVNNSPYWSNVRGGSALTATLNYRASSAISNIRSAAFTIVRYSGSTVSSTSTDWSISVSSSTISSGTGTITIVATPPVADIYSTRAPSLTRLTLNRGTGTNNSPRFTIRSPSWSAFINTRPSWSNIRGGSTLSGRLNFKYSRSISDFKTTAFKVQNSSGTDQSRWNISVSPSSLSGNGYVTVTATPPSDTVGNFRLVVNSLSAKAGTTTTHNVPRNTYASGLASINNRPPTPPPTPPKATVAWSNMAGGNAISGRLTFSGASVTGISSSDFEIINSSGTIQSRWTAPTVSASSASNGSFITVSSIAPNNITGQFRIRIKTNSIMSGGSSTNNAPASSSANTSSAVSINTLPSTFTPWWSNVSGGSVLTGTLNFSTAGINIDLTSIESSDFEIVNTNNIIIDTWSFSIDQTNYQTNLTIIITATPPANTSGRFHLQLKATSFKSDRSPTDNSPTSAVKTTNSYSVNNTVPAVATASWDHEMGGRMLSGRITFRGANVRGIFPGDFQVINSGGSPQTGWTITVSDNDTDESDRITVYADPPSMTNGSFKLRLRSLSVRSGGATSSNAPANNVDSNFQVINNTGSLATIIWSSINGGPTLVGTLSITNSVVDGIGENDFRVLNRSGQLQSGWLFEVDNESVQPGGTVTVTVTPPDRTQNWFALQLRKQSVRSGGAMRRNSPLNDVTSESVFIDNVVLRPGRISWLDITGGTTLVGRLRFRGKRVYGMQPQDFVVVDEFEQPLDTWQISVSHWARNAGQVGTVTALPPANTNSRYKLRLKEITVRSGTTSTDNAPPNNIDSEFAPVDNSGVAIATPAWTAITGGTEITGTLTFTGAAVTGINRNDFLVVTSAETETEEWSISVSETSASNGGSVIVTASPPRVLTGSFKLRLKLNSIQSGTNSRNVPPANLDSSFVPVDNTPIPVVAEAEWANVFGAATLSGALRFHNAAIDGLDNMDIGVYQNGVLQDGWAIRVFKSMLEQGQLSAVLATPPENIFGWFNFRLNALSVMSDMSTTNNAPANNVSSSSAFIDNRPIIVARAEWGSVIGNTIISGRIYFYDTNVRGISSNSFRVTDSVGREVNWPINISRTWTEDGGFVIVWANPPPNTSGAFRFLLLASSVQSGLSRTANAPASSVASPYVSVYNIPIRIANATWGTVTGGKTLSAPLTFTGQMFVTGIEAQDIEVLDSSDNVIIWPLITISNSIVGLNRTITVTATPPGSTSGSFKLRLKRLSVQSDGSRTNNAPIASVTSSAASIIPFIVANMTWTQITGGTSLNGQLQVQDASVIGFEPEDFKVLKSGTRIGEFIDVTSDWEIYISPESEEIAENGFLTVTATPPPNTNGSFTFQLKELSVQSDGSPENNAPNVPISTDLRRVRNTLRFPNVVWKLVRGGNNLRGTVRFGRGVPVAGIEVSDFSVLNLSNTAVSGWNLSIVTTSLTDAIETEVTAIPPTGVSGSFKLQLNELSVQTDGSTTNNFPIQNIISLDQSIGPTTAPIYTVATAEWRNENNGDDNNIFIGQLIFRGADITGLTNTDFEIYSQANVQQFSWEITVEAESSSNGETITISAVPPPNTSGHFYLRLKQRSVRSGGLPITQPPNAPRTNTDSTTVQISNKITVSVNNFRPPEGVQRGATSTFRLIFNTDIEVSALTGSDFRALIGTIPVADNDIIAIDPINGKADEFDIVIDNPQNTRGVYNVIILPNTVPGTSDYLEGPPLPGSSSFVTFDTRSYGAQWFSATYDEDTDQLQDLIGFTYAVTDFSADDFEVVRRNSDMSLTVQSWTITFTLEGSPIRSAGIFASVPANTNGEFALRLKELSLKYDGESELNGPPEDITSNFVVIDNTNFSIATMTWSMETSGSTISARLTFTGATVAGVSADDFEVLSHPDNTVQSSGWVISITEVSNAQEHYVTVSSTIPSETIGDYKFNLKARSLMSGGSPDDNAPLRDIPSGEIAVNTSEQISVISFTAESGTIKRQYSEFILTLNHAIPRDELVESDFIIPNNTTWFSINSIIGGDQSTRFRIQITNPTNGNGSYMIQLRANSIEDGTGYKSGPNANFPSTQVTYDTRSSGITGSWGTVSDPDSNDRSVSCTLTLSADPGDSFDITQDVFMQQQSADNWGIQPKTWTLEVLDFSTSTRKRIKATPSLSVTAGTFRFLLRPHALGTGSVSAVSNSFTLIAPSGAPAAVILEADPRFLTS